jgi:hypothetical protein
VIVRLRRDGALAVLGETDDFSRLRILLQRCRFLRPETFLEQYEQRVPRSSLLGFLPPVSWLTRPRTGLLKDATSWQRSSGEPKESNQLVTIGKPHQGSGKE